MEPRSHWYIIWDGNSVGPWSTETVLDHLKDRKLSGADRIIGEGETEWRDLRDDPFFSRHLKRKPRRKERLKTPKTVRELIQERRQRPPLVVSAAPEARSTSITPVRSAKRFWLLMLVVGILMVLLYQTFDSPKKMRGSEETPPNPPGPATAAAEESDPNSLPKPPTRPERP
jgi:hypothetical protein